MHCVWGTKARTPFLVSPLNALVYKYITEIINREKEQLIELNVMPDHVHLLFLFRRSKVDVARLVRVIKARSSKFIREHSLGREDFSWQRGYGSFAVSSSQIGAVRRYIQNQEKHHKAGSFEKEYFGLLDKHGIVYDKRDVFDE